MKNNPFQNNFLRADGPFARREGVKQLRLIGRIEPIPSRFRLFEAVNGLPTRVFLLNFSLQQTGHIGAIRTACPLLFSIT